MYQKFRYLPSGDSAVVIEVGNEISEEINMIIRGLTHYIEQQNFKEVVELIPTYKSVTLIYNPLIISYGDMVSKLQRIEKELKNIDIPPSEIIHIPTLYGGEYGVDLEYVAQHNGLTTKQVIEIHSKPDYLIYMLGFTPGFTYLGGMSETIATPRLESPREKIPAGAVGIAGSQTGIYPISSPGGWQIIGRTPIKLFDLHRNPEVLLKAGQYVKFEPIDQQEYLEISKKIAENQYVIKKTTMTKEGSYA